MPQEHGRSKYKAQAGRSSLVAEMDVRHPHFDMALELLAMLPKGEHHAVPLSSLASDLGYETQKPIRDLIAELKKTGYDVRTCLHMQEQARAAYIHELGWADAVKAAEAYYQRVYGSKEHA